MIIAAPNERTRLTLHARSARDLMMANLISVRDNASVSEAVTLLTRMGFHAAPVIDASGRPVGVLSYTDILVHERALREANEAGFDDAPVRDLMTPAVFTVAVDLPAQQVVAELVAMNVHQLYVVDDAHVLVGVVTALNVLRKLED